LGFFLLFRLLLLQRPGVCFSIVSTQGFVMKVSEIVDALKLVDAKLVERLGEPQLKKVLRLAFAHVREAVEATTEDGQIPVEALGTFRVRHQTKTEGEVQTPVRRVMYAAKPVGKKAEASAEAGPADTE
jgi:hypothetical protein